MNPTNPFKKGRDKKLSTEEALSSVFDDPKVGEMMRRMTLAEKKTTIPTGLDAANEMTQFLEAKERIKILRETYIQWAVKFGLGKENPAEWIEDTFEFKTDGVHAKQSLHFLDAGVTELPPNLVAVEGDLVITESGITSLVGFPKSVSGHFDVSYNKIESLEGMPTYLGAGIDLEGNKISSLQGLPDHVQGDLLLRNNAITSLKHAPRRVDWSLDLSNNKITSLAELPKHIGKHLILKSVRAKSIPADLYVGGKIVMYQYQEELRDSVCNAGYTNIRFDASL